jgi:hypothetical protein
MLKASTFIEIGGQRKKSKSMHMKIKNLIALVLIVALFASCKRTAAARLHVVYVVDLTASTITEGREKAFAGVKEPFDKGLVKRGDSITVIPITGDALIESQGSILRFEVPANREVYDEDLRTLSDNIVVQLQAMQEKAAANPYLYSDILGAVRIVDEEFANDAPGVRKVLVVLSDFVEDEKQLNFKTSPIVSNDASATEAGRKLAASQQSLKGAQVYLGWLQSNDLKNMPTPRRDAVKTFWTEYFKQAGAKSVQVCSDGPGQLTKFISGEKFLAVR